MACLELEIACPGSKPRSLARPPGPELLQTARANGASRVDVALIGTTGDQLLQISDDGNGLDEPGAIFAHPLPRFGRAAALARRAALNLYPTRTASATSTWRST